MVTTNQPGLFDQAEEKKEDKMDDEQEKLIWKLHMHSYELKYNKFGILHPDRLKEDEILNQQS